MKSVEKGKRKRSVEKGENNEISRKGGKRMNGVKNCWILKFYLTQNKPFYVYLMLLCMKIRSGHTPLVFI